MSLTESVNAFAWDLYRRLSRDESSDVFFSPYSIAVAFAMTFAGARNRTAEQMSKVMRMDGDIHTSFKSLNEVMFSPNASYNLKSANRLYIQKGYDLLEPFLKATEANYEAGLVPSDFRGNVEKARVDINEWVSEQTAGKIKDVIPPEGLDPRTLLVLVNAIYFKGAWSDPFDKKYTDKHPFYVSPTTTTTVDMMHDTAFYEYFEDDERQCQVLELPYKGGHLNMVLVLPDRSGSLTKLESKITPEVLRSWTEAGTERVVHVYIPRFKLESTLSLSEQLSEMGAPDLFDPNAADLSGISESAELFISEVLHKTFVEVNEKGTEAAAATKGRTMHFGSSLPRREEIPTFKADRPFIFLILDNVSGIMLFLGRLVAPKMIKN